MDNCSNATAAESVLISKLTKLAVDYFNDPTNRQAFEAWKERKEHHGKDRF